MSVAGPDQLLDWLWPWQRRYLTCEERWVVVCKARNTGFTDVGLLHAACHAATHPGHSWYLVTTKLDKAREELVRPLRTRVLTALESVAGIGDLVGGWQGTRSRIELPNGSTIYAASNEVDQLRGPTTASYLFDEAATWPTEQLESIREAIFPIIRDDQLNPHGTLRMVSTPKPRQSLYREAWEGDDDKWSRQGVDIYEACECDGFPADDPDTFRQDCRTEAEFLQEYCQVFLDIEGNYFSRAELESLPPLGDDAPSRTYVGVDIGRKHDPTVAAMIAYDGESLDAREIVRLQEVGYRTQERVLVELLQSQWSCRAAALDATAHPALVERIVDEVGGSTYGLRGDRDRKRDLTQHLQGMVEDEMASVTPDTYEYRDGTLHEIDDDILIDDLAKVEEAVTPSGQMTFEAPRDEDGHADSYSALLLAMAARRYGRRRRRNTDSGGGVAYQSGWQ